MITKEQILAYEIRASWWSGYISSAWLQNLASKHFAAKVNRKYQRYEDRLRAERLLEWVRSGVPEDDAMTPIRKRFVRET